MGNRTAFVVLQSLVSRVNEAFQSELAEDDRILRRLSYTIYRGCVLLFSMWFARRESHAYRHVFVDIYVYIHIYLYIHIYIYMYKYDDIEGEIRNHV